MFQSVLLIDDDRITNYLHERVISKSGIAKEINVANNGLEAVNFLVQRSVEGRPYPDLILVDINMPVMDGFEFLETLEQIKSRDTNVVILLLTTSLDKNDLKKAGKYQIHGFFNKPLIAEKLLNVIKNNNASI